MPEVIPPDDLIPMDLFLNDHPIAIDVVYANAKHPENIFSLAVYEPHARMILHKDLARITLKTAHILKDRYGWTLVLKDGLRPVEAQEKLFNSDIVKQNPDWLEGEFPLLSRPGARAHPRGMAIDVAPKDAYGVEVDMGTIFDEMTEQSARDYADFPETFLKNRRMLESAFLESAAFCGIPLLPLPSEWWDFRIPSSHYGDIEPIYDRDLPSPLKMCTSAMPDPTWEARFERLAKDIVLSL